MTLNAKIVSASVRIGGCATSQRMPSAMSAPAGPSPAVRSCARARSTTRDDEQRAEREAAALVANGSAMPTANRNAPIGGATSWFVSRNAPGSRAFAMPEVLARDQSAAGACCSPSRQTSRPCRGRTGRAGRTRCHRPGHDRRPRNASTTERTRLTGRPSVAVEAVRRGTPTTRRTAASAGTGHQEPSETRNGSCVCDATSSGPAATRCHRRCC